MTKGRSQRTAHLIEIPRLLKDKAPPDKQVWFRGQSDSSWSLIPSIARNSRHIPAEIALIKRFKQNASPHLIHRPATEWEWLFLMQHHRLPTRLLDWTESPLTALFFVVRRDKAEDGTLWCLDPIALNVNANINFPFGLEIPAFDQDSILDNYLPTTISQETTSNLPPVAAIATRSSPRIIAQMGTFTINHRSFPPLDQVGNGDHMWRLRIPSDCRGLIRRELATLRYTNLTLFPELDNVAKEAKELLP